MIEQMAKRIKVGDPVNAAEAWAFEFLEANLPTHMATAWDVFNWNLKWAPKDPFKIYE